MEFFITTTDDEKLSAKHYQGSGDQIVIISSAVGISQEYYKHLANFLTASGYDVLTFDYRGISKSSKVNDLNNCSIINWGRHDLEAVIQHASNSFNGNIYLIGHSVAGQIFPFAESNQKIKAAYFVASQNLSILNWKGKERLLVNIFWEVVIPAFTMFGNPLPPFAYGGTQKLPYHVATNWRRWGKHKLGAIGAESDGALKYQNIKSAVKFVGFTDDQMFAPSTAVKALHESYGTVHKDCQIINPKNTGFKEIGHFNYFKKDKTILWNDILEWFEKYNQLNN